MEFESNNRIATVGGTTVAIIIAIVVCLFVGSIVSIIFAYIQYYLSSIRYEAAIFIGSIVGGYAAVYAARISCDGVIKSYSHRTVFGFLAIFALSMVVLELSVNGWSGHSASRLAHAVAIGLSSWPLFWKIDNV